MSIILVVLLVTSALWTWAWMVICDDPQLQCEWIVFAWLGMLLTLLLATACWWWSRVLVRSRRASSSRVVVQAIAMVLVGVLPCGTVASVIAWHVVHDVPRAWHAGEGAPLQAMPEAP
ncbi:MAG: hypothetical protein KDB87_20275 [Flavobacteriales bacterium]|nr:hypothetical protein [Flavobacteriales bacterium]MCB0786236.1 hypothetical protein [Flavobacteriales bacterium]MCB0815488.1 hypothetical protein [Flavobacteriales bacterium]